MSFAPWEAATACTGGPTPGARALMSGALTAYAAHGATNLGIYNCRPVRGTDDTVSCHGEGRACDVGFPMVDGGANPAGHHLVDALRPDAEALGIQAIIYDRVVHSARSPEGRPYTGASPHYDHVHVELTRRAGRELTLATVQSVLGDGSGAIDLPDGADSTDGGTPTLPPEPRPVLRVGSRGTAVAFVQHVVGTTPDGAFGQRTAAAVRRFQEEHGLEPDGVVGPATWGALVLAATPA